MCPALGMDVERDYHSAATLVWFRGFTNADERSHTHESEKPAFENTGSSGWENCFPRSFIQTDMEHTMRANRPTFLAIFGLLLLLTACAKHVHLTPATTVPAASAKADITHDSNGNTLIKLDVKHLARPENLTPPASVYVVWVQPRDGAPIKQGQLQVNKNLNAHFRSPTTYKTFRLFVTAEQSASVTTPSGQQVLSQDVMH